MLNELLPSIAAELAHTVYAINSDDEKALKSFLTKALFAQGYTGKILLHGEVGGRVFKSARDGFGVCAKGAGPYQGDLFLVFRGTTKANNRADFVTNARIGLERSETGMPVHVGFNHTFKSMLPDIQQFISESKISGTIHCVGHSLGGAVASLAADWAATNLSLPVQLYTFGQPRVGLTLFSLRLTKKLGSKNIHRIFHTTDPVPMVPVFPYLHNPMPGYGYSVNSQNPILTAAAHDMETYMDTMKNKMWNDLSRLPPINTHEDAIEHWLRSNFDNDPKHPKTFDWLEKALIWLLKKQLSALAHGLQWAAMGVHTFVDKVAWILAKGMEIGDACAEYVKLFAHKVMRILGIKIQYGVHSLTRSFFRFLLETLTKRANELAVRAVRGISGHR